MSDKHKVIIEIEDLSKGRVDVKINVSPELDMEREEPPKSHAIYLMLMIAELVSDFANGET